jgi:hypothetical protein
VQPVAEQAAVATRTMGARHYFYWFFIILFSFFAFASRVLWIQWCALN